VMIKASQWTVARIQQTSQDFEHVVSSLASNRISWYLFRLFALPPRRDGISRNYKVKSNQCIVSVAQN
jgi:hypothetical protein